MPSFDLTAQLAQTINYECYLGQSDGWSVKNRERFLGTASVELPKIAYQTQKVTGAGISGELKIPLLAMLESLTLKLHWRTLSPEVSYLARQDPHDVALYGAVNKYDVEKGILGVMPVRIEFRGLTKVTETGTLKPNEFMNSTTEFELIALKITIAGEVAFEVNKLDYIFKVDGEDYIAEEAGALNRNRSEDDEN